VSESEFDHANRIPGLKVGLLVYKVSRLSKCQGYQVIAYLFYGRFIVVKQTAQFLPLDTQDAERETTMHPKLRLKLLAFFNCMRLPVCVIMSEIYLRLTENY